MAELGVEASVEFLRSGKKPEGFIDTGVALVSAQKLDGVESLSVEEGTARCWGTK
jgi:fructose transport system substrate-binding protein